MGIHKPDYNFEYALIKQLETATALPIYQRFQDVDKTEPYISVVVTESDLQDLTFNWNCEYEINVVTSLKNYSTLQHDEVCATVLDQLLDSNVCANVTAKAISNQIELTLFDLKVNKKKNEINEYQQLSIISGTAYLMPDNDSV